MPDLWAEADKGCLVDLIFGDQKFIFQRHRQLCNIDFTFQTEIQSLKIEINFFLHYFYTLGVSSGEHLT